MSTIDVALDVGVVGRATGLAGSGPGVTTPATLEAWGAAPCGEPITNPSCTEP
jgi:hypothetical protein